MKTFQIKDNLLADQDVKEEIELQYRFENIRIQLYHTFRNTIYFLRNQSTYYAFKIYGHKEGILNELKGEVELQDLLYQRGAKVSYPINDTNGNFIQEFKTTEAILYGVLYSLTHGEQQLIMNAEQLALAGMELARIHHISLGLELKHQRKEYNFRSSLIESLETLKPGFNEYLQEYDDLYKTSLCVIAKYEGLNLSSLRVGYCHFDFTPYNFHFKEDGDIVIFDFDRAVKGYPVMDIACLYEYYFLLIKQDVLSIEQGAMAFGVFIENYMAVRKLSDLEVQLIPYFCFSILMITLSFKHEYQIALPYPGFLKKIVVWAKELIDAEIMNTHC